MSKFLITLSNLLAFAAYASLCIVFLLLFGALITSNNSFCLIFFCFLLGCSCMLRCVVFVYFVYRFAFYSKLFTWAISCFLFVCYYLFSFVGQ